MRARSRERRAAPDQPQLQRAMQNEPRSIVVVLWAGEALSTGESEGS